MQETWKTYKLGEIVDNIFSGGTPNTTISDYWDGDYSWLSSGETRNKYIVKTEKKITEKGIKESSTRLGLQNDIVIASAGQGFTRGQTSYLLIDTYINQSLLAVRSNPDIISSKFLFFNLSTRYFELRNLSDDNSSRGSLTTKLLKILEVSLPSLQTQNKIAEILSSLDDKIELNNQMNQTLEEMAQAIFKEWFIDFKFPGSDGELVDGLPTGWRMGKVGNLIKILNGFAFKSKDFKVNGKYGVIKIKNISNGKVDIENTQFVDDAVDRFRVQGNDVLIAMTGAEVGKIGIVPKNDKDLFLNQRVGKFQSILEENKWYTYLFLTSPIIQNLLFNTASGSAQPNISGSQIENLDILLPDNVILNDFNKIVNELFTRINQNDFNNYVLKGLRDSLLPKLMSGKIDVKQ